MTLFTTLLLQAATVPAVAATEEKISILYLLKEGGVLMIPLLQCSLLMVYVFVERWQAIKRASTVDPRLLVKVREQLMSNDLQGALQTTRNTQGPIARMIEKGLTRAGKPIDQIEKSMENVGKLEVYQLEKNLSILSTIAGIAPMFGFLGTIAGMIILFFNIQHQGFSLENIAGGIYTKMVTSAVGLIIGLLAYVAHNYLNAQINKNVHHMEAASAELLDILQEPVR